MGNCAELPVGNCAELPVGSWMGMGMGMGCWDSQGRAAGPWLGFRSPGTAEISSVLLSACVEEGAGCLKEAAMIFIIFISCCAFVLCRSFPEAGSENILLPPF